MNVSSAKTLLKQFKTAIEEPKLYIFQFFECLKNEIDIECQTKLNDSNQEQVLEQQEYIIDKVNEIERFCLEEQNLTKTYNKDLSRNYKSNIDQIEANLNNSDIKQDELDKINEFLTDELFIIEKGLFQNKSILFINEKNMKVNDYIMKEKLSFLYEIIHQNNWIGSLILVEDCFIRNEESVIK